MHRLKTRPQFQAVLAAGTVARTAHFALHRLALDAMPAATCHPDTGPDSPAQRQEPQALFGVAGAAQLAAPWMGAMVPKRWARRAVTRNAIKRQIYALTAGLPLPGAAHVVRLRAGFDRKRYPSAWSEPLRLAVRGELQQLFAAAARRGGTAP